MCSTTGENSFTLVNIFYNFTYIFPRWKDVREIEMVRDEGEKKTQQPVKRPNTVNIYSQEDDLILKSDRRLQGDDLNV